MTIPYSRTVLVTLDRTDSFPARRGFGTTLILSSVAKAGKVDATKRTKAYSTMEEVAVDWAPTDQAYLAALAAFSQNPRPVRIKIGYVVQGASQADGIAQMGLLYAYDADWYFLTVTASLRSGGFTRGYMVWCEAHNKLAIIDSGGDVGNLDPANTTLIGPALKGTLTRSAMFWHSDPAQYGGVALAATLSSYNFDEADSAYTAKYKKLETIPPVSVRSAELTALTGFTEQLGQSIAAGHCMNTQIDIGGQFFVVEGSTLTPNVFIDEIHATDWIIARTEEEALGILLNNKRIPFDDGGMEMLAAAARTVMRQANRAGLIALDLDPATGLYAPNYEIDVPSVFDVPESQRKMRIAPEISVKFRYRGAVHYTTIRYKMTF